MTSLPTDPLNGTGAWSHSASVPFLFWCAAIAVLGSVAAGAALDGALATLVAAGLMLAGGLPHGAFDIALAMRAFNLSWTAALAVVGLYLAVALIMALTWLVAPILALGLFLAMSALHFGEDWCMLEDSFLRAMAGLSIICAAGIGQPEAVADLFRILAGSSQGFVLGRIALVLAPVVLLVTSVGLAIAWHQGARQWALAQATALLCLMVAPPVIGFATYFVLLHSPRHMRAVTINLAGWTRRHRYLCGAGLTALCIAALLVFGRGFLTGEALVASAETFRLLSIVAAPHLLLSILLERLVNRHTSAPAETEPSGISNVFAANGVRANSRSASQYLPNQR